MGAPIICHHRRNHLLRINPVSLFIDANTSLASLNTIAPKVAAIAQKAMTENAILPIPTSSSWLKLNPERNTIMEVPKEATSR